jgi:hypothetical protein
MTPRGLLRSTARGKCSAIVRGGETSYINAELLKRERLSLKNHESDVEVNKEESTKLHLSY